MKTCKKCGGFYRDKSKFCLLCGEKLIHRKQIDGGDYE